MRILQINTVCGTGSTGRIATDLYEILERKGHECVIAYGRGEAPKNIKAIKIGSNIDNYVHGIKTRVFDKHGFSSIRATKDFIEKVKGYNPDIIHLHNIHGYYINIQILFNYLKESKKPVIWTLHDCWTFTGHCAYFDYVACDKWKDECKNCIQKNSYPSSKIMDNSNWNYLKKKALFTSLENVNIIVPSRWLANLVEKSFLGKYEIKVINNGIDLNVFKPINGNFRKKYGLGNKFIILGVANVWEKRKGLNEFIKLSKKIDNDKKIVLVGLTEKQLKTIPKNIIGITRTNNIKELVEIYTESNVYINLSVEETMGLTTVEALACGTPVIVNDATAIPEVIDESCGYVVEKNNLDQVLLNMNDMNKKIFTLNDCINRAKLYDKNKKYSEYIEVYSKYEKILK